MRFFTGLIEETETLGILWHDKKIDLNSLGYDFRDMNDLIERITDDQLQKMKEQCESGEGKQLTEMKWLAPILYPKQDVLCLGVNYLEHAKESARYKKEAFEERKEAVYFSKRVNRATGHLEKINSHAEIVKDLDYECELGVILRKDAKNVKKDQVYDTLFGYTIINDVSARTIQHRHKQWYFGKSLDTFCCMGPVIVTKDEIPYPLALNLETYVNNELRQSANTREMIFDIESVITELSAGMTLKSGTIIATGTPSGVAMGMNPPKYLKAKDVVECRIEGLGSLINEVE